jgi:hypothetical protein
VFRIAPELTSCHCHPKLRQAGARCQRSLPRPWTVGILGEVKAAREASSPADLEHALVKAAGVWYPHIAKEETWFSPEIMAQVMTVAEHMEIGQKSSAHSAAHAQPAPLCVPFVLYNVEAEDRAQFINFMPRELTQQLVPIVWKDEWEAMKPFLLP